MSNKTNPGKVPDKRKRELDAVLIQLTSQRPSDVWRGMEQVRQRLSIDKDDRDVYGLLLDAVQKNRDLRDKARSLILEKMQIGSQVAKEAMLSLPSSISDSLADADDAYYAAEYDKAIQLYRQVLRLDAENSRAKEYLAKALLKQDTGEAPTDLPRSAQQFYWRARSYVAAREVIAAMNLLIQAIEAAQAKGMKYAEAEEELKNIQNLVLAEEYLTKAKEALKNKQRKEALAIFKKALKLDPTNSEIREKIRTQHLVMNIWWGILVLFIIGIISFYGYTTFYSSNRQTPLVTPSTTNTISSPSVTSTNKPNITETATIVSTHTNNTNTPISTHTLTPSVILTESITPTEKTLGIGFINKAVASAWKEPNRNKIATFSLNQPLVILDQQFVSGSTWYKCRWIIDGIQTEGWILAENLTFGNPPTPRP